MQLAHLLTRSGLTILDVSLMVSPGLFLPFGLQFFIILGNLLRGILSVCCNQFLLYSCIVSKTWVMFSPFAVYVFVLWSVQECPAVFLIYFIFAAVILLAFLALMVQVSKRYNRAGRVSEDLIFKIRMSVKEKSTYKYSLYPEVNYGNLISWNVAFKDW